MTLAVVHSEGEEAGERHALDQEDGRPVHDHELAGLAWRAAATDSAQASIVPAHTGVPAGMPVTSDRGAATRLAHSAQDEVRTGRWSIDPEPALREPPIVASPPPSS